MDTVYSLKVRGVGLDDKVCGKPARSSGFEARGFYLFFYPLTCSFPWRLVWQSKVPPRVAFISWSASLEIFLQLISFAKKGIIILDWCYMYKRCEKLVDHLLLHCPIAFEMWSLALCLFGL